MFFLLFLKSKSYCLLAYFNKLLSYIIFLFFFSFTVVHAGPLLDLKFFLIGSASLPKEQSMIFFLLNSWFPVIPPIKDAKVHSFVFLFYNFLFLGGNLPYAWNFLEKTGIVSESCLPYHSGDGSDFPCYKFQKCEDGSELRHYFVKAGTSKVFEDVDSIKLGNKTSYVDNLYIFFNFYLHLFVFYY